MVNGMATVFVSVFALVLAKPILVADLGPSSQLMLAAIVAQYSPQLGTAKKQELSRLAAGDLTKTGTDKDFVVSADSIDCRASDVDITSRSCIITFGSKAVSLSGRPADELFSTITEVGVSAGALRLEGGRARARHLGGPIAKDAATGAAAAKIALRLLPAAKPRKS